MSVRGPLARVDDAVLPTLRRTADRIVAPVRRLRAWEVDADRGRLVRTVVRRPMRVATVAGLVLVVAGGVHLQRFDELARRPAPTAQLAADEVGPRVGADLGSYVAGRHELLEDHPDGRELRAVVSFTATVDLDDLPLPPDAQVEAVQLVVPSQELQPRQLDLRTVDDPSDTIDRFLAAEREALDREIDELASTLEEDLGDPAFEADYAGRLEELEVAREDLSGEVAVVFAAIVVAPARLLRALREATGVRAVDPAGPAQATTDARFHGILPGDDTRATTGRPL